MVPLPAPKPEPKPAPKAETPAAPKAVAKTEPKSTPKPATKAETPAAPKASTEGITYKVQIAADSKFVAEKYAKIATFATLEEEAGPKGLVRIMASSATETAEKLAVKLRAAGYAGAFVVKYLNGIRTTK